LHAAGCYPWTFAGWQTVSGGAAAIDPAGPTTTLELSATGVIEALWTYVRPLDTVTIQISPVCGQVILNGNSSNNVDMVQLLDSGDYSLGHVGCANEAFRGCPFAVPWNILGDFLTIFGNGTLT